jgi:glutamyl/glutaminyl-tRNA synthetase
MVRARFAPSPTGELHVGSARTALLNWLFVRANSGRLLLRIDDTDVERSSKALEAGIFEDLAWLGLDWDDGPVHQSDRAARYSEALHELPTHDRDGAYEFEGRVIARADGSALYHLATAVDDVDDAMTHVLRGRDHTANTELQSAIIVALGHEPPVYVHAPLLTFEGAKISKRAGSGPASVKELRDAGYPALAVLNALALSLADFGTEEVMLSLDEMAERFHLDRLHTADSHFDVDKLRWVSGQHIRAMDDSAFAGELAERGAGSLPPAALIAAKTGGSTFVECAEVGRALIEPPEPDDDATASIANPATAAALDVLEGLGFDFPLPLESSDEAFTELKAALKAQDLKLGAALHGLRALLTGRSQGPEFHLILATLTPERIAAARAALT